ncbi:retrotransposon protein, putative, ty1-copia subclass [Tanacetum coccineum]
MRRESYGLGFDAFINTYKMVCVLLKEYAPPNKPDMVKKNLCTMVHVFGTNSWREIPQVPSYPILGKAIFANGCLHWLVTYSDIKTEDGGRPVIWFDVEKEEFGLIDPPKKNVTMEVWVLNKQKEWVPHCRFEKETVPDGYIDVIGCWNKDGDILIKCILRGNGRCGWNGIIDFQHVNNRKLNNSLTVGIRDKISSMMLEEEPTPILYHQDLSLDRMTRSLCFHVTESTQPGTTHYVLEPKEGPFMEYLHKKPLSRYSIVGIKVQGSCNGLICLSQDNGHVVTSLAVIHPLRKECYELPRLPLCFEKHMHRESCGLGFDAFTNTYKMVCVLLKEHMQPSKPDMVKKNLCTMVHVFGTNSWREIPQVPSYPISGKAIFANGYLHWLVTYSDIKTEDGGRPDVVGMGITRFERVWPVKDKLLFLEQPAMQVPPGQVLTPDVLNTHTTWVKKKDKKEGSRKTKIKKLHNAAKGNQGKGKAKMGYALVQAPNFAPKPKNPPTPKKDNLAKDAICHQCGEVGIFNIELYSFPSTSLVYDTGCVVKAIGEFHLCLPSGLVLILHNCLYAPSITRGIILVSHLYKDGFFNHFENNNSISVFRNNLVYFCAIPRDDIYEIYLSSSNTNDSSMYAISNKRAKLNLDSTLLWHYRLGHINKKCMKKLQHDRLLDSTDIKSFEKCVSCMSGKMTRKPYSHQVERAKDLLGLIHTDVCGPFKIVSRQRASYFVTFTDDFSRYGYVYLLKHKNEVFETFKVFKKEVENQLGKTIKSLRSNREGEYMSQEFLDHLKEHRIIAHRTPPYTPQHNGVS